jgi:hypothetical protein
LQLSLSLPEVGLESPNVEFSLSLSGCTSSYAEVTDEVDITNQYVLSCNLTESSRNKAESESGKQTIINTKRKSKEYDRDAERGMAVDYC